MAFSCQKELDFLTAVLERMRLSVHCLHTGDDLEALDNGLRAFLGMGGDYAAALHHAARSADHRALSDH